MLNFETEHLKMRPLRTEDESFYCSCYVDPLLMRYIGNPLTSDAAKRSFNAALKDSSIISPHRHTWVMLEKKSGTTVGLLAMIFNQAEAKSSSAELGNIMLSNFQNRGYTVEALGKLIDIVFHNTDLVSLVARYKTQNAAVTRVMTKLGFVRNMAVLSDASNCEWAIHRASWQPQNPARGQDDYICSSLPIR